MATAASLQLYLGGEVGVGGRQMLRLLEKINLLKNKESEQKNAGRGSNGSCLSLLQPLRW